MILFWVVYQRQLIARYECDCAASLIEKFFSLIEFLMVDFRMYIIMEQDAKAHINI